MATGFASPTTIGAAASSAVVHSPSVVPVMPNSLLTLIPCPYTSVATKARQSSTENRNDPSGYQTATAPRVCRLRTRDNIVGIYGMADPIGKAMLASNVAINLLVEQLSEISLTDESYKDQIENVMQKISYEIENRLLQLTFDRAEDKVVSPSSSVDAAEKILPSLEEAESGAFLCATAVTQGHVYLAFVGTVHLFVVSYKDGHFLIDDTQNQFYRSTALHTFQNDREIKRLRDLHADIARLMDEQIVNKQSNYTRCIGRLSEKLLSVTGSANDISDARCNTLICEARFQKFNIFPHDYAIVMMTDKLYQMYSKTVSSENNLPADLVQLFQQSADSANVAQSVMEKIVERFESNHPNSEVEDLGLLIHVFHRPNINQSIPLLIKPNLSKQLADSEVTVEEVKKFIQRNRDLQRKRELKLLQSSKNARHEQEHQQHETSIEPCISFEGYENVLRENETLRRTTDFITELLYTEPISTLDEKLDEYLQANPSLLAD